MGWWTTAGSLIEAEDEEQARDVAWERREVLRVDVDAVRKMAEVVKVLDFAHKSARDN